jgi:hypothetical protein
VNSLLTDGSPAIDGEFSAMFEAFVREVCATTQSSVPHLVKFCPATLKAFVETHAFEVDNQPFSFEDHHYLIPIFEAIRFDHGEGWSGVLPKVVRNQASQSQPFSP